MGQFWGGKGALCALSTIARIEDGRRARFDDAGSLVMNTKLLGMAATLTFFGIVSAAYSMTVQSLHDYRSRNTRRHFQFCNWH